MEMKILYYLIYSNFFLVNSLNKDFRVILTFIFPPYITMNESISHTLFSTTQPS